MESKIHTYESDEITVTYDIKRCIHAAECVRGLPMVFKPELRRWIQPENSTGERIADLEKMPDRSSSLRNENEYQKGVAPIKKQNSASKRWTDLFLWGSYCARRQI